MIQDPNAPLLSELRWFVRQRWLAGAATLAGAFLSMLWVDWSIKNAEILLVGFFILFYNTVFWAIFLKSPHWLQFPKPQRAIAWAQITLDLGCLSLITTFTDGIFSPLIGLFILHMIFVSLLLQTPWYAPYIAWALAITMMAISLELSNQWPETPIAIIASVGWIATLFLAIYFTTHITKNARSNHERTRAVLTAAADAVLTIDKNGLIELANPAATEMFGYSSAQLANQRIDQIISPSDLPGITIRNGGTHAASLSPNVSPGFGLRQDGSQFPIEISVSKLKAGPSNTTTAIVRDISERERNEAQLRKLNLELENHQSQLIQNEKMAAVGRMAAGVAHEIANPLANMDGLVQLVERNPSRLQSPETPGHLREQVARITQIVGLLKDFAHPLESDRQTISVDKLVESAIKLIQFDRRHQQVSIQNQLARPCCHVNVNPHAIQQVLINLILNALDAAKDDTDHSVIVSSMCTDMNECQIMIQDNGTGIRASDLDHIFEPFFTTKPTGKGTGLGLSISYNLVQHNGGRVEVSSEESRGTVVSIILPVATCSC